MHGIFFCIYTQILVSLTQQSSSRFPKSISGSAIMMCPSTWTFFRGSMKTWSSGEIRRIVKEYISLSTKVEQERWMMVH